MFRVSRAVILTLSLVALALPFGAGAVNAEPLPENYNSFGGIQNDLTNPGGSLPGSNDFGCKPTAEHPRPVVLVHGTGGSQQANWGAYVPMLKNAGFCVFALTYGAVPDAPSQVSVVGGLTPIEGSAQQFGDFVDQVLSATGASTVDVIGHSQGTAVANYYAKFLGGQSKISNYVSLGPLWLGTKALGADAITALLHQRGIPDTAIPLCRACGQLTSESDFIDKLNAGGTPYVKGIRYTNISTRYDEVIQPYTQGQVPGLPGYDVTNVVVQDGCEQDYSDHLSIAGTKRAAYMALNVLDPAHPREVPCTFALPLAG